MDLNNIFIIIVIALSLNSEVNTLYTKNELLMAEQMLKDIGLIQRPDIINVSNQT